MNRPHESPDCRCGGCAAWDYSESRKDAHTSFSNALPPYLPFGSGTYAAAPGYVPDAAQCFADMLATLEKMRDAEPEPLKPRDNIGPVPPWLSEKLREET